ALNGLNTDMHLNAFDFDEKNKVIYMSFRNTNEIVKIAYPSGKILNRYGDIWINDSTLSDKRMFYGQHCVRKSDNGRLYMFNNNSNPMLLMSGPERMKSVSKVSVFEEDSSKSGLKKVWEFTCDIDTFAEAHGGAGGSVEELPDGCLLVSMGSASRIFIVDPKKKLVWNVLPQSGDANNNWYPLGQYRATYLTREELEKFIFNKF
ncbi:MAG: aryl-sulfate sulfotransferase, partial [Chitinophagaceae bacterium]|nr:aryl-sulfate sulfotransferase [Chitinophagaceae bacterium]